jgi:hypothetical protein
VNPVPRRPGKEHEKKTSGNAYEELKIKNAGGSF